MTPFARKVYRVVSAIPIGEVRTYKWVARRIGSPKASRAVGQALKRNPCPFIIPCHRVVSSNSDLGGYVFGRRTKKMLLDLEQQLKEDMV